VFLPPPGGPDPVPLAGGNARPAPRCAAPDAAPTLTLTAETKREAYREARRAWVRRLLGG